MTDHTRAAATPEILHVDRVSVSLAGRQILDEVSFTVHAGEFTGLIGPNGAGKTTLLRVILGLQRPSGGQVSVLGRPRSPRNQPIGYVPQKVLLDPDMPMRAEDLVALGIDRTRYGLRLPSKDRGEAVRAMLHAVHADRFADDRVGNLSGGEQQRVLIAHALIAARLLLLDEPLANLDLRSGQEVIALLARIAREQQIAVVGARDQPAAAGDGPHRLPGRRAGGQRAHRPGRHARGPHPAVWPPRRRAARARPHPGRRRRRRGRGSSRRRTGYRGGLTSMHQLYTAVFEPGFFASAQVQVAATIGAIVAVVSAVVGVFTVMRGQSFAGHALGDVSAAGSGRC